MRIFKNSEIHRLGKIDSTNEELKRRAKHLYGTTWILAESQTLGRGRGGKLWLSGKNNFYGSVMFFPLIERSKFHFYGFFFGVALHNTIKKFLDEKFEIMLKWPNDILINKRKVAGILLESIPTDQTSKAAIIAGIGVNLNNSPNIGMNDGIHYKAESLSNLINRELDKKIFFKEFLREINYLEAEMTDKPIEKILEFWLKRTYSKGSMLRVSRSDGTTIEGNFYGLDESGGLRIIDADGEQTVYAGDVYFGV